MNTGLKKKLLEEGLYKQYMKKRKDLMKDGRYELLYDPKTYEMTRSQMNNCELIRRSKNAQRKKIEDHLNFLKNKKDYDLYFGTFNFADFALDLKQETRKQNIRRLISPVTEDYILNIDYGHQKIREHYHCILAFRKGFYHKYNNEYGHIKIQELDDYSLGFYDLEPIRTEDQDIKKLSRYISKLVLHSVKVNQQYVSVKKGSEYQDYKKIVERIRSAARSERLFNGDLIDELNAIAY